MLWHPSIFMWTVVALSMELTPG